LLYNFAKRYQKIIQGVYDNSTIWRDMRSDLKIEVFIKEKAEVASRVNGVE